MTAIRETFEESGLLLASPSAAPRRSIADYLPPLCALEAARHAIHAQQTNFSDFLAKEGLRADVDALLPFTEWVTPVEQPR